MVLYLRGHPEGGYFPPPIRVTPVQISLAAQIPQAVGMAWGLRLRHEPGVVACFFGDGSSSEGDFYEAANFAGVIKAPVILVCVNNGWAISTPRSRQTAAVSIAAKAAAFGMPGVQIDGNDVLAVRDAVRAARVRAVAGDGPTLIECVTYRLGPHTTADDPTRYVPPAERAAALEREPVGRARRILEDAGRWSDAKQTAAEAEANERLDRAIDAAESTPVAPDAFFEHLYSAPTPRMERQREELHRWLAARED
jgi:pyruvate dehydrogenase E1 component alpha subunit